MVDPKRLAALSQNLSAEDRESLDHLMAAVVNNAMSGAKGGDATVPMRVRNFFIKDGEFSKTSAILVVTWIVGLFLYFFQSLSAGATIMEHVVPAFDSTAFLAVAGAASTLYFANHRVGVQIGAPSTPAAAPGDTGEVTGPGPGA